MPSKIHAMPADADEPRICRSAALSRPSRAAARALSRRRRRMRSPIMSCWNWCCFARMPAARRQAARQSADRDSSARSPRSFARRDARLARDQGARRRRHHRDQDRAGGGQPARARPGEEAARCCRHGRRCSTIAAPPWPSPTRSSSASCFSTSATSSSPTKCSRPARSITRRSIRARWSSARWNCPRPRSSWCTIIPPAIRRRRAPTSR